MELFLTHLKEKGTLQPPKWWSDSKTLVIQYSRVSALSRGILKKKEWQRHQHFNADASNTELLFRIIHSVNQLSIHGAVSNWCEQFGVTGRQGMRKTCWKERIRDQSCIDKCEITRSKTFGIPTKKCFLEAVCGKSIQDSESLSETIRFTRVSKAHRSGTRYRLV